MKNKTKAPAGKQGQKNEQMTKNLMYKCNKLFVNNQVANELIFYFGMLFSGVAIVLLLKVGGVL